MASVNISSPAASTDGKYVEVMEPGSDAAKSALAGVDGALRVASRCVVLFDSGLVAGGAAIASGVLNTRGLTQVGVDFFNGDGVATRAMVVHLYLDDLVTEVVSGGVSLGNAPITSHNLQPYGLGAAGGVAGANLVQAMPIPAGMQFNLAAGGTSNGRIVVYGR